MDELTSESPSVGTLIRIRDQHRDDAKRHEQMAYEYRSGNSPQNVCWRAGYVQGASDEAARHEQTILREAKEHEILSELTRRGWKVELSEVGEGQVAHFVMHLTEPISGG